MQQPVEQAPEGLPALLARVESRERGVALCQERREELVKVARKITEDGRVAVRHIRRDAKEGLKKSAKEAGVSEDEIKGAEKQVQTLTDDCIQKLDAHLADKEKDILTV